MGCAGSKSVKIIDQDRINGDKHYNNKEFALALISYRKELINLSKIKLFPTPDLISKILTSIENSVSLSESLNFCLDLSKTLESNPEGKSPAVESNLLILRKLSDILFEKENFKESIIYLEKAKEIMKISCESTFKECIHLENKLALCHKLIGNFSSALEIYKKIIEEYQVNHDQDLACVYGNIGCCYMTMGNLKLAEEYLNKSLKAKNNGNRSLTGILNNLAVFYYNKGDYEEAVKFIDQSLGYNKDEKFRYKLLNNKAACLMKMRKFDECIEGFKDFEKVLKGFDGRLKGKFTAFYNNYLIFLRNRGKGNEFSQVLGKFREWSNVVDKDCFENTVLLNSLALMAYYEKNFEAAIGFLNKCIELRGKFYRIENFQAISKYNNLGALYTITGKQDLADEFFEKAMNISVD